MAVAAAPAKAVPVLAVEKEAVAAVEGRARVTQAAGLALLGEYQAVTGRTHRQQRVSNQTCNDTCNRCNSTSNGAAPGVPITHGTHTHLHH